jgi:hypothetical protein
MIGGNVATGRFHEVSDFRQISEEQPWLVWSLDQFGFDFENFYHPFIGQLIAEINKASGDPIAAALDPSLLGSWVVPYTSAEYDTPDPHQVHVTLEPKQIDLESRLPYANYNWELLYHIPVAVAVHLSQKQRFAEAQKWFHYVFDPTSTDTTVPAPDRFWKFLYFRNHSTAIDLAELLTTLSTPDSELDSTQQAEKRSALAAYQASVDSPFAPFAVARSRPIAFQYYVVMKYLDNLIAWGDSLFSQMTIETVNEATLCYVLAANLLGPKPQEVPPIGTSGAKTFNDLKQNLDAMSNALVELEGQFPFNIDMPSASTNDGEGGGGAVFGIGRSLYFCIPANSRLLGYWDTVEDRLAKIRNCENIEGKVQLMPLFDPPIDPGLLIKATAAGLDLGSVVSGLNQPVSQVRAPILIQKSLELCAEVKSLGAGLLSAIEKGDGEHLARLRQNNEITLQQLSQNVRFLQWKQAEAATDSLLRTRASALERYTFYLRLVGSAPDPATAPATLPIDHGVELNEDTFDDAYQELVAKYDLNVALQPYPSLQLAGGGSPSVQSGASGSGALYLNTNEDAELNQLLPEARDEHLAASVIELAAGPLTLIPTADLDLHYWGLGAHSKIFGGDTLAESVKTGAQILRLLASWRQEQAQMAARTAGYQRRADDWKLQANLAARELMQNGRQILGSLIAEQAAHREYENAKAQVGQSQDVFAFMQSKFSSEELYGWMQGQLSSLYYEYYRLALDTARKAEATMKWELRRPELDGVTYVQPNYWDSGNQGLLSGESLYFDVKRMDLDYHDYNLRELELTRHVSLRQLDPLALLTLKTVGSCTVSIPEWLYDRDCPGHYMRRIKSVALSVPSVVGPYTSVNCTLTLQKSSIRVSSVSGTSYARDSAHDDPRFVDFSGAVQSVVTSSATSDSGMFETNLRDDRFLPFENAGAISTWNLSLPDIPSFDYGTITDVILHVRYTARDGGEQLAGDARRELRQLPPAATNPGDPNPMSAVLIDLRHDFPTEWYAFATGASDFSALLTMSHFPYSVQGAALTISSITIYASDGHGLVQRTVPVPANMANDLRNNDSTTLDLTPDATVLTRDESKDVYVLVAYSAQLP